jgi:branched-chain amino acid transport system permease protein
VLMFLLALAHVRGKAGRAWAAIRQSEPAALAAGVNITLYKLWAFALASFMTGVAGALLAANVGEVFTHQFPTSENIVLLAVVLMGGIYSLWGAIVAGALMKLLPALLDTWGLPPDLLTILFGVGILQVLLTAPAGLAYQVPRDLKRLGGLLASPFRRRAPAGEGSS